MTPSTTMRAELEWTLRHVIDALTNTTDPSAKESLIYASKHLTALIERTLRDH